MNLNNPQIAKGVHDSDFFRNEQLSLICNNLIPTNYVLCLIKQVYF